MDVLFITPYYKPAYIYGGPARSVPSLCEAMVKHGARVTVFTTNANGPGDVLDVSTSQPLAVGGVEVYYFPVSWPLARILPFYSPALGQACNARVAQFDVVYIAGIWTYSVFVGANSSLRERVPYVISPRGSLMNWSMGEKALKKRLYLALLERRIINKAAAIHVTSSLEKHQLQKRRFEPPVATIPNGIDMGPFAELPQRGRFRHSPNIPPIGTLSLFVGRLHKEKRLDLILNAFATLVQQSSEAHLLIVGSDQDGSGKKAQEQVRQLGLSSRVLFAGQLTGTDLIQAYIDADILVLLSHRESFGMVVVEAMAVGLPVLLAREVGLAEEVEQANAGLVVNAKPNEIGMAWSKLLSNQILREAMGKRGMAFVREQFAADVVAAKMLELFSSVSGRG
jgi:glycosyltransferase involved in cell wall biosynthesis